MSTIRDLVEDPAFQKRAQEALEAFRQSVEKSRSKEARAQAVAHRRELERLARVNLNNLRLTFGPYPKRG